ncbi:phosphatidylglycerol lysyltransferase domain-containing protein [Bdellovibrionota bacterium FG-1]
MPFIESSPAYERFRKEGRNSSHFVWFLAKLRFFESSDGWIFGFTQIGSVTLLALEPLLPASATEYGPETATAFKKAWTEFCATVRPKISAFAAVYRPFCQILEQEGFQWIKAGEEPWVDLADCIPKGNAGKGVRSARNQAIHAGLRVEEWTAAEIQTDPSKRKVMEEIYHRWSSERLVALTGFMNATDPFAHMQDRRYFILKSAERVEAYLVATPVPGIQSYYLEDLITRPHAPRGTGELLTLEAMVSLQHSGARQASLGVVSMNSVDGHSAAGPIPKTVRFFMQTIPATFSRFYNFQGMEIYRKRFKPQRWESVHLCVKNDLADLPDSRAWIKVLWALLLSFKPQLQLTPHWFLRTISKPVLRYPLTAAMVVINFLSFALINHFGSLPEKVLTKYGFFASAPLTEWPLRSVVSDFLYFDANHFFLWGVTFCVAIHWAERKHKLTFLVPFVAVVSLFDDFINYAVLVHPFQFFQPGIFKYLIANKDVGSSLCLATLVGLQLHQFRRLREPLFAIGMLVLVLAFALTSARLQFLVMNLNHVIFLVTGYMTGKVLFEVGRAKSRKASKGKAPVGNSVRQPHPKTESKAA